MQPTGFYTNGKLSADKTLIFLVKETHGSLCQCVSFSLIEVGIDFTAYIVFLFLFFLFFSRL